MKKQAQMKKLVLAKETVGKLDETDVMLAVGGISGSVCTNPTCIILCRSDLC